MQFLALFIVLSTKYIIYIAHGRYSVKYSGEKPKAQMIFFTQNVSVVNYSYFHQADSSLFRWKATLLWIASFFLAMILSLMISCRFFLGTWPTHIRLLPSHKLNKNVFLPCHLFKSLWDTFGHLIFYMGRRHRFLNTHIFFVKVFFRCQHSDLYRNTDFTFDIEYPKFCPNDNIGEVLHAWGYCLCFPVGPYLR